MTPQHPIQVAWPAGCLVPGGRAGWPRQTQLGAFWVDIARTAARRDLLQPAAASTGCMRSSKAVSHPVALRLYPCGGARQARRRQLRTIPPPAVLRHARPPTPFPVPWPWDGGGRLWAKTQKGALCVFSGRWGVQVEDVPTRVQCAGWSHPGRPTPRRLFVLLPRFLFSFLVLMFCKCDLRSPVLFFFFEYYGCCRLQTTKVHLVNPNSLHKRFGFRFLHFRRWIGITLRKRLVGRWF